MSIRRLIKWLKPLSWWFSLNTIQAVNPFVDIWSEFKNGLTAIEQTELDNSDHILLLAAESLGRLKLINQFCRADGYQYNSNGDDSISSPWQIYNHDESIIHIPDGDSIDGLNADGESNLSMFYQQLFTARILYIVDVIDIARLEKADLNHCQIRQQLQRLQGVNTVAVNLRLVIVDGQQKSGFNEYQAYCHEQQQLLQLIFTPGQTIAQAIELLTFNASDCLLKCSCSDYLKNIGVYGVVRTGLPAFHQQLLSLCVTHEPMVISYYFISENPVHSPLTDPFKFRCSDGKP